MEIFIILKLYGPIAVSLMLFFILFKIKDSSKTVTIPLSIGFIGTQIDVKSKTLKQLLTFLSIIAVFSSYLVYDYSTFFPEQLEMEVFFDKEGIESSLKNYDKDELELLSVVEDYEKYKDIYYHDLDDAVNKMISIDSFYSFSNGVLHGYGSTVFKVKKIEGIQNYYIVKSEGSIKHVLERPNEMEISFVSYFEKIKSRNDYLKPTLADIYLKQEIIIKPMFKQIIAENKKSSGTTFNHILYGVTKIHFFPFPYFENTIYLFKYKDVGLIPIAYSIYQ